MDGKLQVYSVFRSIQGESTHAGLPCVFVRLCGCSLGCRFCDTRQAARAIGESMTIPGIVQRVADLQPTNGLVEVTGGEPLEQQETGGLLSALCDRGHRVLLETSGALPVHRVDPRVEVILDIKTPGSGVAGSFDETNIRVPWSGKMQFKFVVTDETDFSFAVSRTAEWQLEARGPVLISPVNGLQPAEVAQWILDSGRRFRLQLQLHRWIWPDGETEV